MNWDDIVAAFAQPTRGYPVAAARAVFDDPEHYARLLSEFERISAQPAEMVASIFHLHAMHLLAEKRDRRAFLPLMRIAALPEELLDEVLGDHLTESYKCCVAAVCDDESLIRDFIENREHAEWARYVLVGALANRVMAGDSPAEPLLEWLVALGDKTLLWLQDQPDAADTAGDELLMNSLAGAISKFGSLEHLATLQRWWDAEALDPQTCGIDWYAKELNRPLAERRQRFFAYRQAYVPDAIDEMKRWYCFSDKFHDPQPKAKQTYLPLADNPPFIREQAKIGRNDPCPCGSGKKFKKCCAA